MPVVVIAEKMASMFMQGHRNVRMSEDAEKRFTSYQTYFNISVFQAREVSDIDGGATLGICPWKLGMLSAALGLWDILWDQREGCVYEEENEGQEGHKDIVITGDVIDRGFGLLELLLSVERMLARKIADGTSSFSDAKGIPKEQPDFDFDPACLDAKLKDSMVARRLLEDCPKVTLKLSESCLKLPESSPETQMVTNTAPERTVNTSIGALYTEFRRRRFCDDSFFGICFGMQMAVVDAARNLLKYKSASSSEFGKTDIPVIGLLTEWIKDEEIQKRDFESEYGGTMRLGSYPAILKKNSKVRNIYGSKKINERHRHRYEVNMSFVDELERAGLRFVGMSPDGLLPEIVELKLSLIHISEPTRPY